jgi:Lrp/AsnC family transcriptional regulator, regulator for asnA, asnC and gidA
MVNRQSGPSEDTGKDAGQLRASHNGSGLMENLPAKPVRDLEPDTLDRQIISLLQADGRCSNREIARQLDVPEATIRYRVRRLTESGLLRITALVAPEHLGYQLTVVISIQVDATKLNEVAETVGAMPEVMCLVITSGATDIVLTASFQDHDHLYEFLTDRLAPVPGIVRSETAIGLKVVKRDSEWAFNLTSEMSSDVDQVSV